MELSSLEINVRIAKALGYTQEGDIWTKPPDRYKTVIKGPFKSVVPNFTKDQGAIIDVCLDLKKLERVQFVTELGTFSEDQTPTGKSWHNVNASARERCLAWLMVKKLVSKPAPVEEVA